MISKVNRCVEVRCAQFYTIDADGIQVEMVEIHIDNLCIYSDEDNTRDLPVLGTLGGTPSVRLPYGAKLRLIFVQD